MQRWLRLSVSVFCSLLFHAALSSTTPAPSVPLICYAYFGFVNDLGYTYYINLGRAWVDAQLGTLSQYKEGVGIMRQEDQEAAMNEFIDAGCRAIVVCSEAQRVVTLQFVDKYPDVYFLCKGCLGHEAPNLAHIDHAIHQASYIAGLVAALQPGVKRLGYVGSNYVEGSFRNVNAFALGAKSVRNDIELYVLYVGSWFTPRNERIAGMQLILHYDVDLLAYDSDSTTVVEVAKEMGKFSIGLKVDGTAAFGESNLMSRIYLWNTVFEQLTSAVIGLTNWTEQRSAYQQVGFKEAALSLGTFSTEVPVSARVKALQLSNAYRAESVKTYCPGAAGYKAFCPPDANKSSPELGGMAPTELTPCDIPSGVVLPEDNDCLSYEQVLKMSWLLSDFHDLGLLDVPAVCELGTRIDYGNLQLCVPCVAGRVSDIEDAEECEACPPGRFSTDGIVCWECPVGQFSDAAGSTSCTNCSAGTAASRNGQRECTPCASGYFAESEGRIECERCPAGSYNDGSAGATCLACPRGETTAYLAAFSAEECICPAGKYRASSGKCAKCPTGMLCELGSDVRNFPAQRKARGTHCAADICNFPRALPEHMTLPSAPLRVYKCKDGGACPGGTKNSVSRCGPNRDTSEIACGLCNDDSFLTRDGECDKCGDRSADVAIFVVIVVVALGGIGLLSVAVNRDLLLQHSGAISVVILGGIFITAMQTAVVFNQLSLDWSEPILSILQVTFVVSFDLTDLKLGCYLPVTPTSRFTGRIIIAPLCLPVLIGVLRVKQHIAKRKVSLRAEVGNAAGTVFNIFYISVVTSAVNPFVCYPHPTDSDTGHSMLSEPAVLCWEGDDRHARLIVIAVLSFILVPFMFLVICLYAALMYPIFMAKNNDRQHWWLHTFRFLFFRFKPGAYAYGVALLFRNMCICLIPAAIPGDAVGVQVLSLAALLIGFALIQATLQPWRTSLANYIDSLTAAVLILILMCGVVTTEVSVTRSDVGMIGLTVILIGLSGLIIGAGRGLREALLPAARYEFFLSHHKAAAAAQARFLQTVITRTLQKTCFLDSDDLKDLGKLFDTLKTSVTRFLLYLTQDTLRRPWCAGEVVVAREAKLPVTKILHPNFAPPTEDQLQDVNKYLASGVNLTEFDLDAGRIAEGLRWVSYVDLPVIHVETSIPGLAMFYDIVSQLGDRSKRTAATTGTESGSNKLRRTSTITSLPREPDSLVISSDPEDLEATAAGGIMLDRIKEEAAVLLRGKMVLLADLGKDLHPESLLQCISSARVVVVILTEGSLHSVQQLQVVTAAAEIGASVIPVSTPSFVFPRAKYFERLLPKIILPAGATEQALKSFFALIAVSLSTHASETILKAECEQIMARVPREAKTSKQSAAIENVVLPRRVSAGRVEEDPSANCSPNCSARQSKRLDDEDLRLRARGEVDAGHDPLSLKWFVNL